MKPAIFYLNYTDFTSFSKLHTDVKTNYCTILEAHWEDTGSQLIFTIKANRFLRNMVRAIVGTMLEIGQGNYPSTGSGKLLNLKIVVVPELQFLDMPYFCMI